MSKSKTGEKSDTQVGSVMVIGGGIAGIQASLDLAESGYKVRLVEKTASIGGTMASLDKTFPTNDCSMCILSPKLVEAGRHLNIDLNTLSTVTALEGKAGAFTARVKKQARYVDPDKCTGCGECIEACPTRYQTDFSRRVTREPIRAEHRELVDGLIEELGTSQAALIRMMQIVNEQLRHIPKGVVYYLAERCDVPTSLIFRIGTFYSAFSFEPRGEYMVSVCTGTACHLKGAGKLLDELKRELDIDVAGTTQDGLFSLETVRCLGCCSLAPVIKIGDRVYGSVKSSQIPSILKDYTK